MKSIGKAVVAGVIVVREKATPGFGTGQRIIGSAASRIGMSPARGVNVVSCRILRRPLSLCLAGVLACGLSACGNSGSDTPSAKPSKSKTPKIAVDTSWEPPRSAANPHIYVSELDQIQYPPQAETDIIRSAVKARVIQCMSEKGYNVPPSYSNEGLSDEMDEAAIEGVYSYSSPENAALYGASTPAFTLSIKKTQAEQSLPDDYLETLYGKDEKDTGCVGKGFEIFSKVSEKKQKLAQSVADMQLKVSDQAEPLRLKLEKKWAACMADAGLSQYTTIEKVAMENGGEEPWPQGAPSAEQVKVAKTSGECMISTGYLEEYSKHQAQIGHAYAQKNPGVITEWKKVHQAEIEAATASLNGKEVR